MSSPQSQFLILIIINGRSYVLRPKGAMYIYMNISILLKALLLSLRVKLYGMNLLKIVVYPQLLRAMMLTEMLVAK